MPEQLKLSVIIVNYNVEHFLEQCLHSVKKAIEKLPCEVFVVDNDSADNSCKMVAEKFPWVHLIANKDNVGFSKANNQAMRVAKGEYFLLLNPDTVVEEDTFQKTVHFMETHSDSGGLGVKMIDGKGVFLPESKRGIPTPMVAFYKIFGLSKLFPRSEKFSRYHLGHLSKDETNEVEILSGAFMLMRKTVLDKIGLLDEDYFMYGEDIDLSYRIIKAGYKNYYYAGTTIIHYKGESTKKGSINYVLVFYRAMIIFARKQLGASHAKYFSFLINCAIYFRASLSLLKRFIDLIWLPVIDFVVIASLLKYLIPVYETYFKPTGFRFPEIFEEYSGFVVASIWLIILALGKTYALVLKPIRLIRTIATGAITSFVVYSVLPEEYRFSRAFLTLSIITISIYLIVSRILFSKLPLFNIRFESTARRNCMVVAGDEELNRINSILKLTKIHANIVCTIDPSSSDFTTLESLTHKLSNCIDIYRVQEVIFAAENMSASDIIHAIMHLPAEKIDYKIAPPSSLSIIGSNSIHTSGELYTIDINSIADKQNIKAKRTFDIVLSLIIILCFPLIGLFMWRIYPECLNVLRGKRTWIGYPDNTIAEELSLPEIKKGVFTPLPECEMTKEITEDFTISYARNYSTFNDLLIFLKKCKTYIL